MTQQELTPQNLKDIMELENAHNIAYKDNYHLIYAPESTEYDCDIFFHLKYNRDTLVSAISYIDYGDSVELSGLTHPAYRNKGYFKELLKESELQDSTLPILYTLSKCMDVSTHKSLRTEYLLELTESNYVPYNHSTNLHLVKDKCSDYWILKSGRFHVGHIGMSTSDTSTCIYDVFVKEKYRGNGFGRILLDLAYEKLDKKKPVLLHVSSDNVRACKIYFNMGFSIKESLDYYIL